MTAAVCAAAAAGALAGCGTVTAPGSATSTAPGSGTTGGGTTSSVATAAPAKVALSFTVTTPGGKTEHWTLRCDPAGGTEPDPAAACVPLLRMKNPFEVEPKHIMCPMILASARQFVVTGTWFGQHVHRVIVDGGCDLGLFDSLGKMFR